MVVYTQWLGFAGTIIIAIAYLPQILHLTREHCSDGISIKAWLLWATADVMIYTHALAIRDVVFIVLGTGNLIATVVIIALARRYRNSV